ncbi:carboxyl-terminal PDZ ligand of neuronal nitric oxide synthase protein-like isoform X2 [Halichondria panicea]|uniref:carboxyl-terminal PDZ ligand of neuronal nitric oxide synthase protein-like isoform X2 n=1 Tax=Halichondria panicea TaxID=6063 RepID=UPI00312B45D6
MSEPSFDRGTATRISQSFQNFTRKLSSFRNKEYNKVEDLYDTRIPLHNEDVFEHGLRFKAKYIGSLEIARPTSKVDIITAMRRIRYEYKVKGIRKARVFIEISTGGVRVSKRKSKRRRQYSEEQLFVMSHPIYRVFYVSHDSHDLKIFSYITREVPNNTFRCNVYKAYKKKMALHMVRSLGQAFDVCHKLNPKPKKKKEDETPDEDVEGEDPPPPPEGEVAKTPDTWKQFSTDLDIAMDKLSVQEKQEETNRDLTAELDFDPFASPPPPGILGNGLDPFQPPLVHPPLAVGNTSSLPYFPEGVDPATVTIPPAHLHLLTGTPQANGQTIRENPFTTELRPGGDSPLSIGESLDKTNPFRSGDNGQLAVLQEQLKAETAARLESQGRVEELLNQNKTLMTQLEKLMTQLTQIQLFQLQSTQPAPTPPTVQEAVTLPTVPEAVTGGETAIPVVESASTEQVITDLDMALAISPTTLPLIDPFQPTSS